MYLSIINIVFWCKKKKSLTWFYMIQVNFKKKLLLQKNEIYNN